MSKKVRRVWKAELRLAEWLRAHGPLATVRVSSMTGPLRKDGRMTYWGVADYELRLGKDGRPHNVCVRSAGTGVLGGVGRYDTRAEAERAAADAMCPVVQSRGLLRRGECKDLVDRLQPPTDFERAARADLLESMAKKREQDRERHLAAMSAAAAEALLVIDGVGKK